LEKDREERHAFGLPKAILRRNMSKFSILKEFWLYLMARKKWWLAPIIIILLLLGILIFFSQGSAVAPFIYTLF
jgi:hypothetical protein